MSPIALLDAGRSLADRIPQSLVSAVARVAAATVFWRSGQTKVEGFQLVLGFASRLSALALLGMTAVIQLFVYPSGWPEHLLWATALLTIIARGPGILSLDHLIWRGNAPAPALAR